MPSINIQGREIGPDLPVYFIADIASNHCGSLAKAKELIHACAESRADAVKMQNFSAESIVSDYGFQNLSGNKTHQASWEKSVFDSYKDASIPLDWTIELKELCDGLGIHYFTSPYSLDLVQAVAPHICAFKLGSGDITWHEELEAMCRSGKPVLIATGASTMAEVEGAMAAALRHKSPLLLMQCNTEYTAKVGESREEVLERFRYINLRVIETFSKRWPQVPIGLSDHTHGDLTVLGAVGLYGCCAVEKHFTFDNTLDGQDHAFSMTPSSWKSMVERTEALQAELKSANSSTFDERLQITRSLVSDPEALDVCLGNGIKQLERNESGTVVVQRRSLRAQTDLPIGHRLSENDLIPLRPCPIDGLPPYRIGELIGRVLTREIPQGDCVKSVDCV
ncbi:N-acetylneuraminate synthase family protein [bacterium]|nr:N-acetylneuraminate synthase family protein [bacterium]